MSTQMWVAFAGISTALALATWAVASWALTARAPGMRRLRTLEAGTTTGIRTTTSLAAMGVSPALKRFTAAIPKSPKEMTRTRRRLAVAGYHSTRATVIYVLAEMLVPLICATIPFFFLAPSQAWILALIAGGMGWVLPGFWISHQIKKRQKEIRNGLPDALDLLIVCIESGSSVDQGIMKVSDELEIAYPALAEEFRLVATETRAGKPRIEAFQNFAKRTQVEDVRVLVATLVQTTRFGTSLGLALRTHAETSRSKRRQRAEEYAAQLGVKLVFPLVLCLFPAFYVVVLGPVVIKFVRVFYGQFINQ